MKLSLLHEMDEKIRRLERAAASGDPGAVEALRVNKVRSLGGWQREMHGYLERMEDDVITGSIFPQLITSVMPLEERWHLYDSMIQDLLPEWHNNVGPQVQDVVDKKWNEVNQFSHNTRQTLTREGEGWWPNWDTGGRNKLGGLLDSYIRILAGIRSEGLVKYTKEGHAGEAQRRIDDGISNFYYGLNNNGGRNAAGKTILRDMLMEKIEEMVYA